ncbi:MAG TPA: glycosyltransferase family 4 protein [Desulfuromonadales bacterium]|nr:glycosyltransferase family 4 protein [Desulfuromonadales bacterium]
MKIGIFVVMAGTNAGGPEVYEVNLIRNLALIDHENEYHVFCLSEAARNSIGVIKENFIFHVLKPANRWISIPVSLPIGLARTGVDFFHATFTPPPLASKEYLFTHHCFSTFSHPEFYDSGTLLRLNRLIMTGLRKSSVCICVSNFVMQKTLEAFEFSKDRFQVVYNGISNCFRPIDASVRKRVLKERYNIDFPYFLYIGKLDPRKNIARIVEAFSIFKQETGSDWKLLLIGKRTRLMDDLGTLICQSGLDGHVIQPGYIANEDLPVLYGEARGFIFPSICEGFGIPVIEAMACGTPVITSNGSSLPEITADAALLVDPYDVNAIAHAMQKLYDDESLVEKLHVRGLQRAKYFSWEKTAIQTLAAYRKIGKLL